ncbi:MAG: helix-turn-helix domain-containing protein [Solirubrobacteraceae bacterium]|nr:helix-turn-helix domain-containing protein [Solirubrobacteraceae bacterium]
MEYDLDGMWPANDPCGLDDPNADPALLVPTTPDAERGGVGGLEPDDEGRTAVRPDVADVDVDVDAEADHDGRCGDGDEYLEPDVYPDELWERWLMPDRPAIRVDLRAVAKALGGLLYHHRRRRRLSQDAMARTLGVDQSRLSRLERGTGGVPTLDTLCRIATTTGARVDLQIEPMPRPRRRLTANPWADGHDPGPVDAVPPSVVAAHAGARVVLRVLPARGAGPREFS